MNLTLSDIIDNRFLDPETECIDRNGFKMSRPNIWYLAGRTLLWFFTFGYFKINPDLDEGAKKVIEATRSFFNQADSLKEINDKQLYDDIRDSFLKLKEVSISSGGSNSVNAELDQMIQLVEIVKEASGVLSVSKTRINRTYGFVDDIRNRRIPDRATFLQKMPIFYPEVEMYKDVVKGSAEFANAEDERERTDGALLFVFLLFNRDEKAQTEIEDKAYQDFIRGQPGKPVLSWESFKELSTTYKKEYDTIEKLDFLLATMAMHDLGKVNYIQKLAQGESVEIELHDEILLHIFKNHPELLASFTRLSVDLQKALIEIWDLDYLGPQFIQGECPPASLSKIMREASKNPKMAKHLLFHDLADLSGAMTFGKTAQEKAVNGCRMLDENTYRAWKKTFELIMEAVDEETAYRTYLAFRAELLNHSNQAKVVIPDPQKLNLNVDKEEDYAITRVCCLLRYFYHEDAILVKDAFNRLKKLDKIAYNSLIAELNCSGLDKKKAILIYYSPALMVNIAKYPFAGGNNQKVEAILEGLRLLNEIYQVTREHLDGKKEGEVGVFTVNATEIASKFLTPANGVPGVALDAVRKCLENLDGIKFNAANKHAQIAI